MGKPTTLETIAANVRWLQSSQEMTNKALSKRSGVSLRMIGKVRNAENCSIETADMIASVFRLTGWHLLNPNLQRDPAALAELEKIESAWFNTSEQGRALLKSAAAAADQMKEVL